MKNFLICIGVLLCLCGAIYKLNSQQSGSESYIKTPSMQEPINTLPPKSDIYPDVEVTEDFPKIALPALISFRKLQNEFFNKRFQRVGMEMGGARIPVSPYVYYDEFNRLPSFDNSVFNRYVSNIIGHCLKWEMIP